MSPSQQPCRTGRDAAKGPVVTTEPVTKNTFPFRRFARMQMTGAPYPVEEICHERDFLEEKTCELLLLAKDELREERVPPLLAAIFDAAAKEPTTIRIQQVQYPQLEEIDVESRRGSLDDTVLEPGSDWQNYKFREQCYVVAPRSEVCVAAPEYPRARASRAAPIPHTLTHCCHGAGPLGCTHPPFSALHAVTVSTFGGASASTDCTTCTYCTVYSNT